MGGEGQETTVICSSIALLQERFRQLERVKEMREERELLRFLSEPNNNNNKHFINNLKPVMNYKPSRLFFHPDLIFPQRSSTSQEVSLSMWPTFRTGFEDDQYYCCSSVETPQVFMNLWHLDTSISPFQASSNKLGFDDSHETDVDTSLHL